jgi:hypothetical protein
MKWAEGHLGVGHCSCLLGHMHDYYEGEANGDISRFAVPIVIDQVTCVTC